MFQEVKPQPVGPLATEKNLQVRAKTSRPTRTTADGLILAGMHSWGDDILERVTPKPLWPVALLPLIAHGIQWLRDGGIAATHICANSETSTLRSRLGTGEAFGTSLTYYEDRMPRGPAGCVRDATPATHGVVVVEGSIVPRIDFDALLDTHTLSKAAVTVAVQEAARQPSSHSVPGDRSLGGWPFDERLEPIGIYVCSPSALLKIPASGYQDIKEGWIPRLYADGLPVVMHQVKTESAPRVTDAASCLDANLWATSRLDQGGEADRLRQRGFHLRQRAWVHESATIAPNAKLKGPMLIGPKCIVRAGAMIIGPAVLGRESVVEQNAVVIRSVTWDRCTIGAGAMLDGSILTDRTSIDAKNIVRNTVLVASDRSPSRPAD